MESLFSVNFSRNRDLGVMNLSQNLLCSFRADYPWSDNVHSEGKKGHSIFPEATSMMTRLLWAPAMPDFPSEERRVCRLRPILAFGCQHEQIP
jgi:hypothetical protein